MKKQPTLERWFIMYHPMIKHRFIRPHRNVGLVFFLLLFIFQNQIYRLKWQHSLESCELKYTYSFSNILMFFHIWNCNMAKTSNTLPPMDLRVGYELHIHVAFD